MEVIALKDGEYHGTRYHKGDRFTYCGPYELEAPVTNPETLQFEQDWLGNIIRAPHPFFPMWLQAAEPTQTKGKSNE